MQLKALFLLQSFIEIKNQNLYEIRDYNQLILSIKK